jgi:hypothetical protein
MEWTREELTANQDQDWAQRKSWENSSELSIYIGRDCEFFIIEWFPMSERWTVYIPDPKETLRLWNKEDEGESS